VSKNRAKTAMGFGACRKNGFAQIHDKKADSDEDDECQIGTI